MRQRLTATLMAALMSAAPRSAHSTEVAHAVRDPNQPAPVMGLTVSGGVSLGSFEAGYLYYISEMLKLNPGLVEPRIFTGASAGSVNALLMLMSTCSPAQPKPEDSVFWRMWIPIGLSDLFDPKQSSPIGLFQPRPLLDAIDRVKVDWNKGLPTSCDAMLGVAVTRLTAARVELVKDRVTLPRTEAKFVFRIRGQGPNKPPLLTNYVTPDNPVLRPLLPSEADGNITFDMLSRVLMGSAAFPLAFSPVPILHCQSTGVVTPGTDANQPPRCTPDMAQSLLFIDGGVFDNQPLRLAVQLAQRGLLREGGAVKWQPVPDLDRDRPPANSLFIYVDPDVEVLPNLEKLEAPPSDATVPYVMHIMGELISSGRTKELQALLEDQQDIKKQIGATRSYFMPLSQPLRNFFGFFERDFREHDFFLGMHSAHRYFEEAVRPWAQLPALNWPEVAFEKQAASSWQPLRCMQLMYDGLGPANSCDGLSDNMRASIQTTLDRLYARCDRLATETSKLGKPVPPTTHDHCRRAFLREPPPRLAGLKELAHDWHPIGDEPAMDYELRRLADNGFVFTDLGLPASRSKDARRVVAQKVGEMARAISSNQSDTVGALLPLVARVGAQSLDYNPPLTTMHLLLGRGVEFQYSGASSSTNLAWLRGTAGLSLEGLLTLIGSAENRYFALQPHLGGEAELAPLSGWTVQSRLGLRAGYQFSTADSFATVGCTGTLPCTRIFGDVYFAATIYQLVRLQLGLTVLPPMRGLNWSFAFSPQLGVEFDQP